MNPRRLILPVVFCAFARFAWPQSDLTHKLLEVRSDLQIHEGKFTGSAAPVLEKALSGAKYVLIGEDHMTHEIPEFAEAVCNIMARQGFTGMAVETGPQVAKVFSASLGKPDRIARMAALTHQYPDSVAFLNVQEENDLAAHCAEVSRDPHFQVWGLDQEFVGSSGWLLDQILATHPRPAATTALEHMKAQEKKRSEAAFDSGDPSKLFLFSVSDAELSEAAAVLKREANPFANELFHELVESHEIYLKNMQGSPDSNSQRAQLLKQNLKADLGSRDNQRVLLKFGDWHLYKGFNPLHQRDLGNYVAELADGEGSTSLHICVLGAKGAHVEFAGYNRPPKLEPFVMADDNDYHWIKPMMDNQVSNGWTLFDLRRLRFQKLGTLDPDMERFIYGYDLMVVIPELTPASLIH